MIWRGLCVTGRGDCAPERVIKNMKFVVTLSHVLQVSMKKFRVIAVQHAGAKSGDSITSTGTLAEPHFNMGGKMLFKMLFKD
jgi:hypothetical protein